MKRVEQDLLQRLEASINHGYASTYGKNDALEAIWSIYCKEHNVPRITIHEVRRGRARVRCILTGDMTVRSIKPLIEQIGQEVGLIDCDNAKTHFDVKRAYDAYDWEIRTCSSIPTTNAVIFVEGIINLLRMQPDLFTLTRKPVIANQEKGGITRNVL